MLCRPSQQVSAGTGSGKKIVLDIDADGKTKLHQGISFLTCAFRPFPKTCCMPNRRHVAARSTGGLEVDAGGLVVKAGGLTVTSGAATVATGGLNVQVQR